MLLAQASGAAWPRAGAATILLRDAQPNKANKANKASEETSHEDK
jgi:hypothetical protein